MLTIHIVKRRGKTPLLRCVRGDGSETVAELAPGPVHDLGHYVVESELGFRRAFFGLLAEGWSIQDFDVPGAARRLDLPDESVLTEYIVGLLQIELVNGEPYEDFNAELRRAVASGRRPGPMPPEITDTQVARMRERFLELAKRWHATPAAESMELVFPDQ